jgi:hypothetical protein
VDRSDEMRVVVERLHRDPPHGLTCYDVKAIVHAAERDLGPFPGLLVHLKATLPGNTRFDRPVIYSGPNRLNVLCRGMTREQAAREILRELVVLGTDPGLRYGYRGHQLSAKELAAVDARVETILPEALAGLGKRAE